MIHIIIFRMEENMKNLANVLAVLLLVVALGLMVGCGCGTTTDQTEEDMVGNTTEAPAGEESTVKEDMTTPDTNPIDGSTVGDDLLETDGTVGTDEGVVGGVVDDAGNAVGDVIDGVGNAVEDVGDGVGNAVEDVGDGVKNVTGGNAR